MLPWWGWAIAACCRSKASLVDGRSELILSNVPPMTSTAYKHLLGLPGKAANGQVLGFTQSEVWSMPSGLSDLRQSQRRVQRACGDWCADDDAPHERAVVASCGMARVGKREHAHISLEHFAKSLNREGIPANQSL